MTEMPFIECVQEDPDIPLFLLLERINLLWTSPSLPQRLDADILQCVTSDSPALVLTFRPWVMRHTQGTLVVFQGLRVLSVESWTYILISSKGVLQ